MLVFSKTIFHMRRKVLPFAPSRRYTPKGTEIFKVRIPWNTCINIYYPTSIDFRMSASTYLKDIPTGPATLSVLALFLYSKLLLYNNSIKMNLLLCHNGNGPFFYDNNVRLTAPRLKYSILETFNDSRT